MCSSWVNVPLLGEAIMLEKLRVRWRWRSEFGHAGYEHVKRQVAHGNFSEEKMTFARTWLSWRDNALTIIGLAIAFVGSVLLKVLWW
jgi:hypothetical protein